MKDALAIHRWLLAHQVHHEIVRLPRPMTCAEELPSTISVAPERCVAVTVFETRGRLGREVVAVVSTVAHPPTPGQVGRLLGVRSVRPAPAFVINAATDYAAGLVSPLLLPHELPLLVDDRIPNDGGPLFTPTGERRTALRLHSLDLLRLLPSRPIELPRGVREAVALRH
ncbi:YbaK/EbsC family protein [Nonomuraea africana]|uniref:Prolyl-tRNA editing enzyme YbaK/EbsC (Cys-tRNA(Pro) deacylase) n=1 Tax=Nonomuraea africana TaxID=46171 RepID=A0ABR9KQR1_9ACTN|nr:YbaK/EbsC family protein [Nonomuraea africana]MBE1564370.1 prolyl-tRNA editing enzyme YbaK/EbsC (Cys-tRNA(Pro) deacylase) [Nonomuraea africana]